MCHSSRLICHFDGTLSTEVIPRILSGASGNQQGASTGAMTDTLLIQPSNICEAVNSGVMATGAVDSPAISTGSVGNGQSVSAPPSGGKGCTPMADLDLAIPRGGGPMDIEMTSATARASPNQAPLSLSGGVHRVPTTPLVGIGVDSEDQTAAGEPTGGKGPLRCRQRWKSTRWMSKRVWKPLWHRKGFPNTLWLPQGSHNIFPSMRPIWSTSTPTRMPSMVSRTSAHAVGVTATHLCL
jgi:hypothetical protein